MCVSTKRMPNSLEKKFPEDMIKSAMIDYKQLVRAYKENSRIQMLELEARLEGRLITGSTFEQVTRFAANAHNGYDPITEQPIHSGIAYLRDGVRVIYDDGGIAQYAEKKSRIQDQDDVTRKIRVSLSSEHRLPAIPPVGSGTPVQRRSRRSFRHRKLPYTMDLTVTNPDSPSPRYEVEIEYTGSTDGVTVKSLSEMVEMLWDAAMSSDYLRDDVESATNEFNRLTHFDARKGKVNYPLSRPIDIDFRFLHWDDVKRYAITLKADGTRVALFFNRQNDSFAVGKSVSHLSGVSISGSDLDDLPLVFDCEYVKESDTYHVFDCVVRRGRYIMDTEPLNERLKHVNRYVNSIQGPIRVLSKSYSFFRNVDEYKEAIARYEDAALTALPYAVDGIIFQERRGSGARKWKPPELLTIDFAITANPPYIAYYDSRGKMVPFSPSGVNPASIPPGVPVGSIAEFKFDKDASRFVFYRPRPDKPKPNHEIVAKSVFTLIRNPITLDTLALRNLVLTRKYHNRAKMDEYKELKKLGVVTLLDVGSGTGGDVVKWKENRLRVTALEMDGKNYAELARRSKEANAGIIPIHADVLQYQTQKVFDAVTMFNSLTFFSKNAATLDTLIDKINRWVKPRGYLLLMYVDGKRFQEYFPRPRYVGTDISVTYASPESNEIVISINASGIVHFQTEYLVDADTLRRITSNYDVVTEYIMNQEPLQSLEGKMLSESTTVLLLRKRENLPYVKDSYSIEGTPTRYPTVIVHQSNDSLIGSVLGGIYLEYINAVPSRRDEIVKEVIDAMRNRNANANIVSYTEVGNALGIGILIDGTMYALPQSQDYVKLKESGGRYSLMGTFNTDTGEVMTVSNGNNMLTT